jgi:luciferase family oxidoreductase group 1
MPSDLPAGQIWMLGSTLAGASIAAQLGVPYSFAGHFAMRHAVDAIAHYRSRYEPSREHPAPYAMLAVTAVCAPTDDEANRLAAPLRVAIVKNRTGRRAPILSVEDALAYQMTPDEQAIADEFFTGAIIGSPDTVAGKLAALATDAQADELMLSTLLPSLDDRKRSLELIARAASIAA